MKTLTDHKHPGINDALDIEVLEGPDHDGAHPAYHIFHEAGPESRPGLLLVFQAGSIQEHGVNGISEEALLAVVIDRLRGLQTGPYACRERAVALTYLETCLMWLQKRTRDHLARGVEDTSEK